MKELTARLDLRIPIKLREALNKEAKKQDVRLTDLVRKYIKIGLKLEEK